MKRQILALAAASALTALATLPGAAAAQGRDTTAAPQRGAYGAGMGGMRGMRGMRGGPGGPMGMRMDPATMLLARRDALKLDAGQVKRLEAIHAKYDAKDRPLMDQLRQAWSRNHPAGAMGPGARRDSTLRDSTARPDREQMRQMREQRRAYLEQHPELKKAMQQLRDDRQAMRKEAFAVLTPAQQQTLKQEMQQRRGQWRERGDSGK